MVQRIVVNWAVGGFVISQTAFDRLVELGEPSCVELYQLYAMTKAYPDYDAEAEAYWQSRGHHPYIERNSPLLLQVIDELGLEQVAVNNALEIIEVPDGVEWHIVEDDPGNEWVQEVSRMWFPKQHWYQR